MDDQNFTIVFPFDERTGWVLVFLITLIIGSAAIYAATSNRNPISQSSEDWRMKALGVALIPLAPIWVMLLGIVLWALLKMGTRLPTVGDDADALRWGIIGFVGLLTALAGLLGTPLALIRVYTTERQTRTAEQSHITDRISKAVEQLGATRKAKLENVDITLPNSAIRIGGLYELHEIANQRPAFQPQIAKIIAAFIRSTTTDDQHHRKTTTEGVFTNYGVLALVDEARVAFAILCTMRPPKVTEPLDFSYSDFKRRFLEDVKLVNGNLRLARFSHSIMEKCEFHGSNCAGANFERARLYMCKFGQGCCLRECSFKDASAWRTDFSDWSEITQSQLDEMFGHANCEIPNGLTMPSHWANKDVDLTGFRELRTEWLTNR